MVGDLVGLESSRGTDNCLIRGKDLHDQWSLSSTRRRPFESDMKMYVSWTCRGSTWIRKSRVICETQRMGRVCETRRGVWRGAGPEDTRRQRGSRVVSAPCLLHLPG